MFFLIYLRQGGFLRSSSVSCTAACLSSCYATMVSWGINRSILPPSHVKLQIYLVRNSDNATYQSAFTSWQKRGNLSHAAVISQNSGESSGSGGSVSPAQYTSVYLSAAIIHHRRTRLLATLKWRLSV